MGFKLSEKAKAVLRTIAPTLGTAIGGPFGTLAGATVAAALGASSDAEVEEALLAQKPESLLALKQGENDFKVKMRELDIKEDDLVYRDRDSARQREVQTKDNTNRILAFTVIGAFIAVVCGLLLGYAQVESALAGTLVGYLSAKAEQVLAYYFGSSLGSKQKDELLLRAPPPKDDTH